MNKINKNENTIIVMCDYCADGLWLARGGAIDAKYLFEELTFNEQEVLLVEPLITQWQEMYENFDFYSAESNTDEIYAAKEYNIFKRLGRVIAISIKIIAPPEYTIEFFEEHTTNRFIIDSDLKFKLKPKCDRA